jgi:hypothetical protein
LARLVSPSPLLHAALVIAALLCHYGFLDDQHRDDVLARLSDCHRSMGRHNGCHLGADWLPAVAHIGQDEQGVAASHCRNG